MRKNIFVALFGLICIVSVVLIVQPEFNTALQGAENSVFYMPGDIFKETGTAYFKMGGANWRIAYVDETTGDGIIIYDYDPTWTTKQSEVDHKIVDAQAAYDSNFSNSDTIGKRIQDHNSVTQLKLMNIAEYNTISNNETDFSIFQGTPNLYTWLEDRDSYGERTLVRAMKSCTAVSPLTLFQGKYICRMPRDSGREGMVFTFNVKIPSRFTLKVQDSAPAQGYTYKDNVQANTVTHTFTTIANKGMLKITDDSSKSDGVLNGYKNFELVDQSGNAVSSISSEVKGNIRIKSSGSDLIDGSLKAGVYNFCIVLSGQDYGDKSSCYSVKVKKAMSTVSFDKTAQTKIKLGANAIEETIVTNNTEITSTGNTTPQYILTEGVSGTGLSVTPDPNNPKKYKISIGSTSSATLPAKFKLKVKIPETENYQMVTSTEKEVYVYKELSNLIWTATHTGNYSIDQVVSNSTVGSLLASDGISKYTYALTSSSDSGYVANDAIDNSKFSVTGSGLDTGAEATVKTNTSLSAGTYKIQFKVTDGTGDIKYVSATIQVSANAQAALNFVENNVNITSKSIHYNDTNISIRATGGETTITSKPTYTLSNPSDSACLKVTDQGNGTAILTPVAITKQGKTVKVKATKAGNGSFDEVNTELSVTILPAIQFLQFDDTSATKRVRSDSNNFFETAKGSLDSSVTTNNGIGGITYSSSNENVATINSSTGEISVVGIGTTNIKAILNDPKSSSYDANYETKTITKTIQVYAGMSVNFTPASLQAEKTAILNANAGTLVPKENNGSVSYKISTSSDPKNIDASWFKMNGSTIQLTKAVSGSDLSKHIGGNTFKVQVDVTDQDGTITIDCEITIRDAENDFYFVNANNVTEKITSISEVYGLNKTFQLQTHTSNGGAVSYKLKDSEDNSIVSVATDGTVTILKVGGPVQAEATVQAGSGYAAKTITIPVSITASSQSIAFQKSSNESVKFVKDTTYATPAILKEADGTVSTRAITYISETKSICTIDSTGNITMLATGDCKIKAENSDADYVKTTASKTITLYDGMGGNFTQSTIPQAEKASGNSGSPIGSVSVSGGQGNKTYSISSDTQDNSEKDFFSITSAGVVSIKKNISASDLATLPQDSDGNYIMKAVFTATDTLNNVVNIKAEIKAKGAELQAEFETDGTGMITKTYSPNGTFTTEIINNNGKGVPVFSLKTGANIPTDVLKSIDPASGIVTIENAVEGTRYAYLQADISASGGYSEATIEVPVNITKAQQDFKFNKKVINLQTESSIELEVSGIVSKQADGTLMDWAMVSQDQSLVKVNGHTINGTKKEGSTTITASVKGDRNYKAASDTATVNVSSAPAYDFTITVPNATYGDTGLQATIFTDEGIGVNKVQIWESSDTDVATIDPATGVLTILKVGKTTITCTQTSDGEPSVKATATFVVDPKPITITIEDANKKVGEVLPSFHAIIPTSDLVGSDTIDQPIFSCKDHDNKPVTNISPAGEYDITGSYVTGTYPNYEITVSSGTLTVTQDESTKQWYELIGKTSSDVIAPDTWVNEDVYVALKKTESTPYDEISLNQKDWNQEHILVETEGITKTNAFFQKSDTYALATSQDTTIKIDKTKPEIRSITGESVPQNRINVLLNQLTFGKFFKPQDEIIIRSEDILNEGVSEYSGIKEVSYKIYELDQATGIPIDMSAPYDEDTITDNAETISFRIDNIGTYRICAISIDHAGNKSNEKCSNLHIKEIDVDKDEDGTLDLNDSNTDGCPDLNIVLGEDEKGNHIKLNIAEENKKYPYMNIDSNGDGKADLNIDSDHDGLPDVNLVIMNETLWNDPTICVTKDQLSMYSEPIEYCTGTSAEAVINIDLDITNSANEGYLIPDINIDTTGDMKADINISKTVNGVEKPYLNMVKISRWVPEIDYVYDGFSYDTMGEILPLLNVDSDHDGLPDINIDFNEDGTPDLNIDVNHDGIPDTDIDSNGDGKADLNLDPKGTGTPESNIYHFTVWEPNCNTTKDGVAYDTMEIIGNNVLEDQGIIVKPSDQNTTFLPNLALKVKDVTNDYSETKKEEILQFAKLENGEVGMIYDVKLLENDIVIQPNGRIEIQVPVNENYQNPKLMMKSQNGTWEEISYSISDGKYIFSTDYIGEVAILSESAQSEPEPTTPNDPETKPTEPITEPSVQGTYTPKSAGLRNNIGGASTGDTSTIMIYLSLGSLSLGMLYLVVWKRRASK